MWCFVHFADFDFDTWSSSLIPTCVPQNPQTKVNYQQFSAQNHLIIIHFFLQAMMQHATATKRIEKNQDK